MQHAPYGAAVQAMAHHQAPWGYPVAHPVAYPVVVPAPDIPGHTYMGRPLASWSRRVVAYLADWALTYALLLAAQFIPVGMTIEQFVARLNADVTLPAHPLAQSDASLALVVLALGVHVFNRFLLQGFTGKSLGKWLFGIRVVRIRDGGRAGVIRLTGRALFDYFASLLTLGFFGLLGALWPLWHERRQTLKDMTARTLVIDE